MGLGLTSELEQTTSVKAVRGGPGGEYANTPKAKFDGKVSLGRSWMRLDVFAIK